MKLWTGRFSSSIDEAAEKLNNSLPFDKRMAFVDIKGSIAWAHALGKSGILSKDEEEEICRGLICIKHEFEDGSFDFHDNDEDIHTAVERRLIEIIGAVGGKLHTGRSRNDQVVTDFRLWIMETLQRLIDSLSSLQMVLINRAEMDMGIILPGYTHFQQAQPILLSHWWLSHFWALYRDQQRFSTIIKTTSSMPLGSGALAGCGFDIDRFSLAAELNFLEPSPNSLDAVSDRDFACEFLFAASLLSIHLSRLAEALILYSTNEYGFIELADEFSTGSSLMPQKKNPDPLELTRAKSGMVIGRLVGVLATLKGLPSAYDKDLQEDKPAVFEVVDTLELILPVVAGTISSLIIHQERSTAAINWQILATDLADYLVKKGIPFRQAHHAVGQAVKQAEISGIPLKQLPLDEWKNVNSAFDVDLFDVFDIETSINNRSVWGGTAPKAVKKQLDLIKYIMAQKS